MTSWGLHCNLRASHQGWVMQSFSRRPPLPGTPITLIVPLKFVLFAVDTFPFNASGSNEGHQDTVRGIKEAVHL